MSENIWWCPACGETDATYEERCVHCGSALISCTIKQCDIIESLPSASEEQVEAASEIFCEKYTKADIDEGIGAMRMSKYKRTEAPSRLVTVSEMTKAGPRPFRAERKQGQR